MQKTTRQSVLFTLLTIMACKILFVFLFAMWKASMFQRNPFVVFALYGLVYPSIHIAAMWAVMGPGSVVHRQVSGMAGLLLLFGSSCGIAWSLIQYFDVPSLADEVARIMSGRALGAGGLMRMTQYFDSSSCRDVVLEIFFAVPILYLMSQVPVWLLVALGKSQLTRGKPRPIEMVTIRSLFFFTAIAAFSFACLSAVRPHSVQDTAIGLLIQSGFVCVSFVVVCWPLMWLFLSEQSDEAMFEKIQIRMSYGGMLFPIVVLMLYPFRLPRMILAMLCPVFVFAMPYGLLLMQLRRLGFRLGSHAATREGAERKEIPAGVASE